LKGLEVSIVSLQKTIGGTSTRRFDPEYFQKQHLVDESLAQSRPRDFQSFADLDLTVDGSAFYPAIEDYYGTGELPFIRVADVDAVIDFENCTRIPAELCDRFPTLCRIYPGDLVFTKGGSVARIGLVTQEAAASRDLIFLNTSKLSQAERTFLYVYSQTAFFNRMLLRSSSQTAQPHLTITLVRNLPALRAGNKFKEKCVEVVEQGFTAREKAITKMNEVEATLTAALGLGNWQPPEPLSYTRRASEAFTVNRIDAEYFQPKYQALLTRARKHAVRTRRVHEFAEHCDRGEQPEYFDDGTLAVVTSKHILETGLDYGNFDRTRDSYWNDREFVTARIFKNDILTYTTGAKVGRTAVYLDDERALASNHVNVLRLREENPVYVAVVMNSLIGRWQTRMIATGSAQVELYPNDINSFVIPFVDTATESAIVSAVRSAHAARARARELLDRAKRAVEIAIEQDEKAALSFLG
jgi:hypothetical protein